ncbi:phosphatase PAP2 family protein [Bacteroidetes bacterium endosymbiont of Geopemphigus sp.]|uniref:phosphatase PAP2 family protein n=1 Tax=Bacteroidetes bacterium endosymbiont of Geopemphigus sp. TaxID=2047937 RepID=UPI000CD31B78|nr:phosphatase PAP2 family protein [Bacteroidetes bacterium endosymbiont of Geopemphigus sp.]
MIENFSLLKNLLKVDERLLVYINHLGAPFMDNFWVYITRMESWFPVYLLLILLFYHLWGWKKAFFIICFIGGLILCVDQSADLFKYTFKRYRPCHEPSLVEKIRLIQGMCRGSYGFFSAHSANHFALTVFLGKLFHSFGKHLNFILIFWASLVAYSRIYLAAHYPLDVIFGMGAGAVFGYFFGEVCHRKLNFMTR